MNFSRPEKRGCALAGRPDAAYEARFAGPVTAGSARHELVVTHDGSPVDATGLCINTEMVGMSGMGYTDEGHQVGPGRYAVDFRFGMAGTYRGNVIVPRKDGEVSIPMSFKVAAPGR